MKSIATSRRKVLALLGLAPIGAPLAAKAAADAQFAKLTGISLEGAPALLYGANSGGAPMPSADWDNAQIAATEYIKTFGLPEFVRENMWRNSQYVNVLDPDLVAKRSWSMSVKIAEQRQRNFKRNLEQMQHTAWHSKGKKAFRAISGWDWPW